MHPGLDNLASPSIRMYFNTMIELLFLTYILPFVIIRTLTYSPSSLVTAERVSYSSNGNWSKATDYEDECRNHFLCTGDGYTWKSNYPNYKFYNSTTGCEALLKKGIKNINFRGDSYMRQIYSGLLITLSGDYQFGSISNGTNFPKCSYHAQFYERNCGLRQLNHYGLTCNGKILLDPLLNGLASVGHCKEGLVELWSFGNHKLGSGRYGVNNATAYVKSFEPVCHQIAQQENSMINGNVENHCSVWWISTHARRRAVFPDETPELVKKYNEEMRKHYDSGHCGKTNYIDVYNMTSLLLDHHDQESEKLTYDGVHWGMEVNLIKAQLILNAIINHP